MNMLDELERYRVVFEDEERVYSAVIMTDFTGRLWSAKAQGLVESLLAVQGLTLVSVQRIMPVIGEIRIESAETIVQGGLQAIAELRKSRA